MQDPVLNVNQPVAAGAVDEFPAAFAEVREQLGINDGPIGVMGGSMGGLAAQLAVAEGGADVRAAVLINPVVRLRDTIDGLSVVYGMSYPWPPPAAAFAERADFVARAGRAGRRRRPGDHRGEGLRGRDPPPGRRLRGRVAAARGHGGLADHPRHGPRASPTSPA